jgi:hypothetical protein
LHSLTANGCPQWGPNFKGQSWPRREIAMEGWWKDGRRR